MERSFSCLKEGEKKIEPFQNGRGKKLDKLDGNDGCSNRCSRVLGACYRRARIRFKTIRCGRGCLLSLSAAPQPGTRERGRERERVFRGERKTAPSRATSACFPGIQKQPQPSCVSLTMNARETLFLPLLFARNLHIFHLSPPRVRALPFIRVMHRIARGLLREINNPCCVSCTLYFISYHVRYSAHPIIRRIVHALISVSLLRFMNEVNFDFVHIPSFVTASRFFPSLSFRLFRARSTIHEF